MTPRWWTSMLLATLPLCAVPAMAARDAPALAIPAPPAARLDQRVGAALPLTLPFVDSAGRPRTLARYVGDRPMLLVLGYYQCPQLCGLLMHGLLQGLHDSRLAPQRYRIVRVSVDPADTPAFAAERRRIDQAYAAFLWRAPAGTALPDIELLTGPPASLQALAAAIGWQFSATPGTAQALAARFAHPATVAVITPDGRVSRYLNGLRFEPDALQAAIEDAGDQRIGTPTSALALLCAHFDPRLGQHSEAVVRVTRLVGLLLVAALATAWWRQRPKAGVR